MREKESVDLKEDMRMDENMNDAILSNLASLIAERVLLFFEDEETRRGVENIISKSITENITGQK